MAWYYGTYACGHEGRTNIVGPTKNRQWIADKRFERLCPECYEAKLKADREAANAEAAKKAKEMELPELYGTPKQIEWANTIRVRMLEKAYEIGETQEAEPIFYQALEHMIKTYTKASWYIDNRNEDIIHIIADIAKTLPSDDEKQLEKEVRAESVVYPENCQYSAPAEISVKDDEVSVIFEKNDAFREIVKALGYKWDGKWIRKITDFTGTAADRAAELGNKLLNAGFPISILDPDIRRKAIEADYEPECDRWIYARVKGDYTGWLEIVWAGHNDELYQAARKLPRSRWDSDSKSVMVKPEYFPEVEDFTNMFGFRMSKGARKLIQEAKAIKEAATVVTPAEPREAMHKDGLKDILKSGSDVIDDLIDN